MVASTGDQAHEPLPTWAEIVAPNRTALLVVDVPQFFVRTRYESGLATLAATFGTVCSSQDVLAAWGAVPVPAAAS